MASIRQSLYQLLAADLDVIAAGVAARIYHGVTVQDPTLPYVVLQRIGGVRNHASPGGAVGVVESRWQITCWADEPLNADPVAEAVRKALDGYSGTVDTVRIQGTFLENDVDLSQGPTDGSDKPVYGRVLDFLIWYDEATS